MGMAILTRSVKALVALTDHNPKTTLLYTNFPCTRVSWLGIGAPILTRLIKSIYLINHNPILSLFYAYRILKHFQGSNDLIEVVFLNRFSQKHLDGVCLNR